MAHTFFVTGTDTEVGKTFVSTALLAAAEKLGKTTSAIKPVAAGCEQTEQGLRNEDALALQAAMTLELPYEQINPVTLEPAIAPHIAAERAGRNITVSRLAGFCRGTLMHKAGFTVIEGAGGWRVPINRRETLADLARELQLPVILVVGMRLGCLNHALLTAEAIVRDGLQVAGWVANHIDPTMSCYEENLESLKLRLPFPCLGILPHLPGCSPVEASTHLHIENLFNS